MYCRFEEVNIRSSQRLVRENLPQIFREKFSDTSTHKSKYDITSFITSLPTSWMITASTQAQSEPILGPYTRELY